MNIFLAMPSCGQVNQDSARSFYQQASQDHDYVTCTKSYSALASNFNHLWINALAFQKDRGYTHFAMLHSDVSCEPWWLDKLVKQMEDNELHVLSSVIAIKDGRGLTSTAVGPLHDDWDQQRLTISECKKLPSVFTDKHLKSWKKENHRDGQFLLLNTGCWIADLRTEAWKERNADGSLRFFFTQKDRVLNTRPNEYEIQFAPEDWLFSRECHKAGLKIGATTGITVTHHGSKSYDNKTPGTLEHDSGDK